MVDTASPALLRVGIVGSGFMANFHLQAFLGVRNARIAGVFSPTPANREAFAEQANRLELGPCRPYESVEALVASPEIDAIWICGPNDTRLPQMRAIHGTIKAGQGSLRGIACEKPLGRDLAEAREMLALAEDAGLNHGYLENQVFAPAVQRGKEIIWRRGVPGTGRPYLARAAEEHSGPHKPWFWRGDLQGGGVLSDMMCHSVEVARFLLTAPERGRDSLTLTSANATVATLKWARPAYAAQLRETMGPTVDYTRHPAEDFARGTLTFRDEEGAQVIVEATTSWSYVGPGLRIQLELLGPEYSMAFNSLNSGLSIFLSRQVGGQVGEDLVEKQGAEQGLLPVLEDEAATYGYTAENRHMVEAFRKGVAPLETFQDGVAVVEMLMALYRSAELGRTITLPDDDLATYRSAPARGNYRA
jgi:predicted dehydrogenase